MDDFRILLSEQRAKTDMDARATVGGDVRETFVGGPVHNITCLKHLDLSLTQISSHTSTFLSTYLSKKTE